LAVPVLAGLLLSVLAGPTSRRLPPATAVRLLTATGLAVALGTGFVLAVTAFDVVALIPAVAAIGHWSIPTVRAGDPIPAGAGTVAAVAVIVLLGRALWCAWRAGYDLAVAVLACRQLGPAVGRLVVVHDLQPDAYALPGLRGRIVVSTGMLQALPADERRVLLAHEDAHLNHHHHLYVQAAHLAAAANPLLRPLTRAVETGIERWADEIAADTVHDRRLAARALARAGLASTAPPRQIGGGRQAAALPATDTEIAERVRALLADPPRHHRGLTCLLAGVGAMACAAALQTAQDTEHHFEAAQAHYAAEHPPPGHPVRPTAPPPATRSEPAGTTTSRPAPSGRLVTVPGFADLRRELSQAADG
jgi:Zn-dependent protease with chaperone function